MKTYLERYLIYSRVTDIKQLIFRDTELKGAKDFQIAFYAQKESLCLLTGDYDFSDIRNYPPLSLCVFSFGVNGS